MSLLGRARLGLLLSVGACASRTVPIHYPANAASSLQAPEAKPLAIGLASAEDEPAGSEPVQAPMKHDHAHMHGGSHEGH